MSSKTPGNRRARGFNLIELILVMAAIALGTAATYQFYEYVQASQSVHVESQNTVEITNRIMKAYSTTASFEGLDNAAVINDRVIPPTMRIVAASNTITNNFGGTVTIGSETIGSEVGRGFSIVYNDVPKRSCTELVQAVTRSQRYQAVYVSAAGQTPSTTNLMANGSIAAADLAAACDQAQKLDVRYVYQRNEVGTVNTELDLCVLPSPSSVTENLTCNPGSTGTISRTKTATCPDTYGLPVWGAWVVTDNCLTACTPAPTSPETSTSGCASGFIGTITSTRTSTCPASTGAPVWSNWSVVSDTCAPVCVAPPPEDDVRSDCPSGQSGTRTYRRTATCPSASGAFVWGNYTLVSNNCVANCALPSPSVQTQWVAASGSCDAGYSGTKTWEKEQISSATCPSGTSQPGTPTWSSYSDTGATRNVNTSGCVSLCTPASPLVQWVNTSAPCPVGSTGSNTWEREQTRTSVCPVGASSPTTSTWTDTGQTRNAVNTCAAPAADCSVTAGTKSWSASGNACSVSVAAQTIASGFSLNAIDSSAPNTGTASYLCTNGVLSATESAGATCNVTAASCNVAAGSKSWSVGGNSCSTSVTAQTIASGSSLSAVDSSAPNTGAAAYVCTNGVLSATESAGATCNVTAASCNVSAGTKTWAVGGNTCSVSVAAQTVASGSSLSAVDASAPNTGSAGYLCTNGVLSSTVNAGATCAITSCTVPASTTYNWTVGGTNCSFTNATTQYVAGGSTLSFTDSTTSPTAGTGTGVFACVNGAVNLNTTANVSGTTCTGSCPAKPADATRSFAGCAINQYGSWTQTSTWTSAAFPTCWTATAYTPTTAPVGACTSCPAASTETATEWDPTIRTQACPVGQTGSITFEAQRTRNRSVSYSCPAGTATLPAPTYGTYSAWTDTGATRNVVNTCTSACTPTYQTKIWDRAYQCQPLSLYEDGTMTRQERFQALGTCSGGTQTWPAYPTATVLNGLTRLQTFPYSTYPGWTQTGCYDSFGAAMSCTGYDVSMCVETGGGGQ